MLSAVFLLHRTYLSAVPLLHCPAARTSAELKTDWFWAMAVVMAALNECVVYASPSGRPASWLVCLRSLFTNVTVTNFPEDRRKTGPSSEDVFSMVRKCTGQKAVSVFLSKERASPLLSTDDLWDLKNIVARSLERETSAQTSVLGEALLACVETRSPIRALAK